MLLLYSPPRAPRTGPIGLFRAKVLVRASRGVLTRSRRGRQVRQRARRSPSRPRTDLLGQHRRSPRRKDVVGRAIRGGSGGHGEPHGKGMGDPSDKTTGGGYDGG